MQLLVAPTEDVNAVGKLVGIYQSVERSLTGLIVEKIMPPVVGKRTT